MTLRQTSAHDWYKDALIYELHIKAFHDDNNDGIGDFAGLISKLEYIKELGVTAIWLLPFYPSPQRDGGYDIADYYSINEQYGTIEQFQELLTRAHELGLKVITELVINHTSDQHPWFTKARNAPAGSDERNYYVWSDSPEAYKGTRIIFQDFEASNWTFDPVAKQYFWHRFYSHQPDLNFDNPAVQQEIFKILDFWCDMGVDGFRLDAIPYLFEREGTNNENLPETHDFLRKVRSHVDENWPGTLLLAEANMWPEESASYFGDGDECHMNYHFPIMPRLFMSMKMENRYPIIDIIEQTPEIPENCQWGMFLRNHDELTLEMVTDEERDFMYKAYNKDDLSRINLGIRHRLAPLMDNNRQMIELMNVLLLSMPGTPVIYYGDEIGMGDNIYLGDRDGVRTPMQWNADRNGGFSKANPQQLYLPAIADPEYSYQNVNVETQQNNTSSLLWWMRKIISTRKKFKVFGRGTIEFLSPNNHRVLAFIRKFEEEIILVICNLSRYSQAAQLDLHQYQQHVPYDIFSQNAFPEVEPLYTVTLGPHGYYWLQLKPLHQINQQKIRDPQPIEVIQPAEVFGALSKAATEQVLAEQLMQFSWFGGHERTVESLDIEQHISLDSVAEHLHLLIIQVNFTEGFPHVYQLPVLFVNAAETRPEHRRAPIILEIRTPDHNYKGVYAGTEPAYLHHLLRTGLNGTATPLKNMGAATTEDDHLPNIIEDEKYTTVGFEPNHFLKVYRKLEHSVQPEVEVLELLQESEVSNLPKLKGTVVVKSKQKAPYTLAAVQQLVQAQGTAWSYFTDSANRYIERLRTKSATDLPAEPLNFLDLKPSEEVGDQYKGLVGSLTTSKAADLGSMVRGVHKELQALPGKAFEGEDFSLHYQRSLLAGWQTLIRNATQALARVKDTLSPEVQKQAQQLNASKGKMIDIFKQVTLHRINALKIRTHGDFTLQRIILSNDAYVLADIAGEYEKAFSEKRLRKSPLRDVASILHSLQYAGYSQMLSESEHSSKIDVVQKVSHWYCLIAWHFLTAYLSQPSDGKLSFLPENHNDVKVLLKAYLLERSLTELIHDCQQHPERVEVSLNILLLELQGEFKAAY